MLKIILISVLALVLSSTLIAEDLYGVFADGVSRTRFEEEVEWNHIYDALGKGNSCRSPVRMERKNGRWRISAGLGRAWYWIDRLSFALSRIPSDQMFKAAVQLKELEHALESELSTRRGVLTVRGLLGCP